MADTPTKNAVRIARTEWTRHHREFDGRPDGKPLVLVGLLAVAVGLGTVAYVLGHDLAAGRPMPRGELVLAALACVAATAWRSARVTHTRFERLNTDLLLTTVPARTVALGLLSFVAARVAAVLLLPTVGVVLGFTLGLRSPAVAITVTIVLAGLATLAIIGGSAGRLAAHLVGRRLARGRSVRDLLLVFGWIPILAVWLLLQTTSVSLSPLLATLESTPLAWLVDLALPTVADPTALEIIRALGAFTALILAIPPLGVATTVLARRIWEADPVGSTVPRGDHAFLGAGRLDRVLEPHVSRPVWTVASKRWLVERRVPRGLLSTAYAFVFGALVLMPVFAIIGAPTFLLLVVTLGLAVGIAVGGDPIGAEYQGLPMLLTSVDGRTFVGGYLLATAVAGVALVTVVVAPVGLLGPATVPETVALVLVGVAVCLCTGAVSLAVELTVDRTDLVPVTSFFTDVTVYAEVGSAAFRRLGTIFAIVSITVLPAVLGNVPVVYDTGPAVGVPVGAVRVGSLLSTVLVAAVVATVASRVAVRRYRAYRID